MEKQSMAGISMAKWLGGIIENKIKWRNGSVEIASEEAAAM